MTIEITPLANGCELTLTTQDPDEWADDASARVGDDPRPARRDTARRSRHVRRRPRPTLGRATARRELPRGADGGARAAPAMLALDDPKSKAEDAVYHDLAARYRTSPRACVLPPTACRPSAICRWSARSDQVDRRAHEGVCTVRERRRRAASPLRVAAARDEQMLASMQRSRSLFIPL